MADRPRDLPMVEVLELQRDACARAGSELYAIVLDAMADDVRSGGTIAEVLEPWTDNALADAIPLRLLAGVHALVLQGRVPDLARFYASAGGHLDADRDRAALEDAFRTAVDEHVDALRDAMHHGVQTNEAGRAAALVGGFHAVAARSGLPLRTLEVGASAGLLQRWDRYRYVSSRTAWGPADSPVVFDDPYADAAPPFVDELTVAERGGCDVAPIDASTAAGRLRLRSFLWPDQVERRRRLDAALEVVAAEPVEIEQADAGEWIAQQLADPRPGVATVVYHSIVLQYLPRTTFERLRTALVDAGERATPDAPVGWLRMEPAGDVADVRLRWWGGDGSVQDDVLATTGYHGPPVTWLGPAASG